MDVIKELNKDLEKGFSKRDLEILIGLPKNSLSNILKGKKNPSKKYILKVEKWAASEKPDPLSLSKEGRNNQFENAARGRDKKGINNDEIKIQDATKHANIIKPTEQPKTNFVINTTRHKKYKEGDPPEKSNAFFLKYGVFKYDDI
jgi:transcriptional regulator with XRE-family HTH domain